MPRVADLKRVTEHDGYAYRCTLEDGRVLTIVKVWVTRCNPQTSTVWEAPGWCWVVSDLENMVQADRTGFMTRAAALGDALDWAGKNPKGTVQLDHGLDFAGAE